MKIFEKKIEVPWDFLRAERGSNSAPGNIRISPIGDFTHLWYEIHHHGSRLSGLRFGQGTHFGYYRIKIAVRSQKNLANGLTDSHV